MRFLHIHPQVIRNDEQSVSISCPLTIVRLGPSGKRVFMLGTKVLLGNGSQLFKPSGVALRIFGFILRRFGFLLLIRWPVGS